MKQFLSSDVCLACEGCCRFDKEKSDWRPKIGKSEKICSQVTVEQGGYLNDKLCQGIYVCGFFNSKDTTCTIYQDRPFECQLYPFVLTGFNQNPAVSVHLSCPYVQEKKETKVYDQYVSYLKDLFLEPEVGVLLKASPHLFGKYLGYESELEWVFDVKLK